MAKARKKAKTKTARKAKTRTSRPAKARKAKAKKATAKRRPVRRAKPKDKGIVATVTDALSILADSAQETEKLRRKYRNKGGIES